MQPRLIPSSIVQVERASTWKYSNPQAAQSFVFAQPGLFRAAGRLPDRAGGMVLAHGAQHAGVAKRPNSHLRSPVLFGTQARGSAARAWLIGGVISMVPVVSLQRGSVVRASVSFRLCRNLQPAVPAAPPPASPSAATSRRRRCRRSCVAREWNRAAVKAVTEPCRAASAAAESAVLIKSRGRPRALIAPCARCEVSGGSAALRSLEACLPH